MRRLFAGSFLGLGAIALVAFARPGGDAPEGPYVMGIGAELMTQQAPQQVPGQEPLIDRGMFDDPRGPQLDYEEVQRTAGRFPFYWTRAIYSGGGFGRRGGGGGSWAVDFPKSDQQFLIVIKRLMRLNAYDWENPVYLGDPVLRKFPLIYMLEVGRMYLSDEEVEGLRGYMDAGGFVIVDDFWGSDEWDVFEFNMRRVYPDKQFVDIPLDHPLYSAYYTIDHVEMTPAIGNTERRSECEWENCFTQVKGLYDEEGRLMMVVNFNTDLGDAWEWAEQPSYPLETSTYAFEIGTNMIVYAMSH
ncbi:MAG: DUF4159 domain-containing protein [Longimicrobiales bacterium]